ncbi:MAG: hypothetical protein ACLFWH_15130 [Actinomycetota bacterium]
MTTKTHNGRPEARIAEVTDRLQSIGQSIAAERSRFEELRRKRLSASLGTPDQKQLERLDTAITRTERNIADLEDMRSGVEPIVERLHAARGRVIKLERDLTKARAKAAAVKAFASVQEHLANETLPVVEKALDAYRSGGLHRPPSLEDLSRSITDTWVNGPLGMHLEIARRDGFDSRIPKIEQQLQEARQRLVALVQEIDSK